MRWIAPVGALAAITLIAGCTSKPDKPSPPIPTISESPTTAVPPTTASEPNTTSLPQPEPLDCSAWSVDKKQGGKASIEAEIYAVRVGRHSCYERVVFDIDSNVSDITYHVQYVALVYTEGKGDALPVPKAPLYLQVVIHAPAKGYTNSVIESGASLAEVGGYVVPASAVSGWKSLRGVRFGGTFEGQSTFAVGIGSTTKRPFEAFTGKAGNGHAYLAIDVATN